MSEQEPKITVSSEWVHTNGLNYVVTAIGNKKVLIEHDNEEYSVSIDQFHSLLSPKPKTVTMYFYKDKCGLHARELDFGDSLFTKEIEL